MEKSSISPTASRPRPGRNGQTERGITHGTGTIVQRARCTATSVRTDNIALTANEDCPLARISKAVLLLDSDAATQPQTEQT